jgi:AraC family transcriptional regulator
MAKLMAMAKLVPTRFEEKDALLVAGLCGEFNQTTSYDIPELWGRLGPQVEGVPGRVDGVPGRVDGVSYGVCFDSETPGSFHYLAGVEVTGANGLPSGFTTVRVPAGRYAVFAPVGGLAGLREAWKGAFAWVPKAGYRLTGGPQVEWYSADFEPAREERAEAGSVEIWLPVVEVAGAKGAGAGKLEE